jgi:hypothetical protein
MSKFANFETVYFNAVAAGMAAGQGAMPEPMVVVGGVPGETPKAWYVSEGACGFAWVNVKPGNSSFAKWLVKNKFARKAYEGGVQIWVSQFNQSMARKEAYAEAMAAMFRNALGVKAYAGSRMD